MKLSRRIFAFFLAFALLLTSVFTDGFGLSGGAKKAEAVTFRSGGELTTIPVRNLNKMLSTPKLDISLSTFNLSKTQASLTGDIVIINGITPDTHESTARFNYKIQDSTHYHVANPAANNGSGNDIATCVDNPLLTAYFDNVGTMNGRSLNVAITIRYLDVYANGTWHSHENDSSVVGENAYFLSIYSDRISFGSDNQSFTSDKHREYIIDYSLASVTYADDGSPATGGLFWQLISDVDTYGEGWYLGKNEYTGPVVFSGSYVEPSVDYDADKSVLDYSAPRLQNPATGGFTDGSENNWAGFFRHNYKSNGTYNRHQFDAGLVPSDEIGHEMDEDILKAGGFAPWAGTSAYFAWTGVRCASDFQLYASGDDRIEDTPKKTVSASQVYSGDSFLYTISYNKHSAFDDITYQYDNLVFSDVLPAEVSYNSLKVFDGNTDVTSSAGTVNYNSSSHTLTYTFNSTYLSNTDNYNGNTLSFKINVTGVNNTKSTITAKNKASLNISGLTRTTSEVTTDILPLWAVTTYIDHGTITPTKNDIKTGEDYTVTWSPDVGYYVYKVVIDGVTDYEGNTADSRLYPTEHKFTNISKDHDIKVYTKKIPKLVISKTVEKQMYHKDERAKFTITLSQTVEDAEATNAHLSDVDFTKGLTIDMDSITCDDSTATINKSYNAVTNKNSFEIEIPSMTYDKTVVITFEATIDNDKLETRDLQNTATVRSDQTMEVSDDDEFTVTYKITTDAVNGTIDDEITDIPRYEDRTVNFKPWDGYYLVSVCVDGDYVDPKEFLEKYDLTNITDDHDIKVVYEKIPEIAVEKTADKELYKNGETIHYTISVTETLPNAQARNIVVTDKDLPVGVSFVRGSVKADGVSTSVTEDVENNGFTVTASHVSPNDPLTITFDAVIDAAELESDEILNCVTAEFKNTDEVTGTAEAEVTVKVAHDIITEVENGTIDDDILGIPVGEDRTISYKPDDGYYLDSIYIDGILQDDLSEITDSYDFKDIRDDHSIKVVYKPYHKVTGEIDHGTMSDDNLKLKDDSHWTMQWSPADGWFIATVEVDGEIVYDYKTTDATLQTLLYKDFRHIFEDHHVKVVTKKYANLSIMKSISDLDGKNKVNGTAAEKDVDNDEYADDEYTPHLTDTSDKLLNSDSTGTDTPVATTTPVDNTSSVGKAEKALVGGTNNTVNTTDTSPSAEAGAEGTAVSIEKSLLAEEAVTKADTSKSDVSATETPTPTQIPNETSTPETTASAETVEKALVGGTDTSASAVGSPNSTSSSNGGTYQTTIVEGTAKTDDFLFTIVVENKSEESVAEDVTISDEDFTDGVNIDFNTVKVEGTEKYHIYKHHEKGYYVVVDELAYGDKVTVTAQASADQTLANKDFQNTAFVKSPDDKNVHFSTVTGHVNQPVSVAVEAAAQNPTHTVIEEDMTKDLVPEEAVYGARAKTTKVPDEDEDVATSTSSKTKSTASTISTNGKKSHHVSIQTGDTGVNHSNTPLFMLAGIATLILMLLAFVSGKLLFYRKE